MKLIQKLRKTIISSFLMIFTLTLTIFAQVDKKQQADKLYEEASALYQQQTVKSYQAALEKLQKAIKAYQEIDDKSKNAGFSFFISGLITETFGEKQTALKFYKQSLKFFQANKYDDLEAGAFSSIGGVYSESGEKLKALNYLKQALSIYKRLEDKSNEGATLHNIGTIYDDLGEKQEALSYFNQALPVSKLVGDKQGESVILNSIGLAYREFGEKQKALEYLNQSLLLRREVGNKNGEAATLNNIGLVYIDLGGNQKSLEYFNLALVLRRQVGNKKAEAEILNNISSAYSNLGEKQKALELLNDSLAISKQVGDKDSEASTLNNIGAVYFDLGENQKALENFNQALGLRKHLKDKDGEAMTLNNIGLIYSNLGEKRKAMEYFNQALSLRIEVKDKSGEATTLDNIGSVYFSLGDYQKALKYFSQALLFRKQAGNKQEEAKTLNNISLAYSYLEEYEKALESLDQSLVLRREFKDKHGEATVFNNFGSLFSDAGKNQIALKYFNQSLILYKQVGDKHGEATSLNNIGGAFFEMGEDKKALEYYQQVLPLIKQVGDKRGEAATLSNVMDALSKSNKPHLTIFYGKQSVNKYQELRQNIQGLDIENQQTFLKSVRLTYRKLTEVLIKSNRLAEAQQVLNSFKDQQFFDFNQTQIKQPVSLALTLREKDFLDRYEKTSAALGTVGSRLEEIKRQVGNRQPSPNETAQLQKLKGEIKTETDAFLTVLNQAEIEFSKSLDEKDKVREVPDLKTMQTALRQLNQQTRQNAVAIYQLVGEEHFSALVISEGGIEKVSVVVKGEKLNDKARKLWALLQSDRYDTTKLSKEIYDVVFAPLEAKLPKNATTIMWSLDGNLRYVPMAALWDGKQFLAERYRHAVFTRADGERMTRNVSSVWTGTGFGSSKAATVEVLGIPNSFSELKGVTEELEAIFKKGIVKGATFPDEQFSKTNFLAELKKKRPLVHIASHFSFRPGDEARSFLLMGDGTAFTLEEMKSETSLFQGVELLTLSACNTAAAQHNATGREIDGFAELAQRLGAGAVMATLWQVSDVSTPWLMREFYITREIKIGTTKAEALQKAQLALLNGTANTKPLPNITKRDSAKSVKIEIVSDKKKLNKNNTRSDIVYLDEIEAPMFQVDEKKPFAHPHYWSPFILFGNWK